MAKISILQITILSKISRALRHNLGLWIIILICNDIKYIFCTFFTWISDSRDIVGNTTTLCNLFIYILKIGFNFPNSFCLKNKRKQTMSKNNHLHLEKKNTKWYSDEWTSICIIRCPILTEISWGGRAKFCPILEILATINQRFLVTASLYSWIQQVSVGPDVIVISNF